MYGSFIREVRNSRNLTQLELAGVSGISQPNISAIENDRRVPTVETLNRLLVACGYELAAVAGSASVYAPAPRVGWFAGENTPPAVVGDPIDERSTVGPATTMDERNRLLMAVLDLSSVIVTAKAQV